MSSEYDSCLIRYFVCVDVGTGVDTLTKTDSASEKSLSVMSPIQ